MSRSLTATFMAALMAGQTSEIYHTLVVLSGGGITTRYYVNNYQDVTGPGAQTYTAVAFAAHLPHDVAEQIPDVNMVIDNVDRAIIADIRSATAAPDVTLSIVLQSDPTSVEIGPLSFKIRAADYNKLTVSGTLKYEDILNESFPKDSYTPQLYPGLFP